MSTPDTKDSSAAGAPEVPSSIGVTVVPKLPVPVAPYANSTYTHRSNSDITLIFMRIPLLRDEDIRAIMAAGENKEVDGDYIASITLPVVGARELAERILKIADMKP